jgi:hypothetical protein
MSTSLFYEVRNQRLARVLRGTLGETYAPKVVERTGVVVSSGAVMVGNQRYTLSNAPADLVIGGSLTVQNIARAAAAIYAPVYGGASVTVTGGGSGGGSSGGVGTDMWINQDTSDKLYIALPAMPKRGNILYYSGSAWINLANGIIGEVLLADGEYTGPTWSKLNHVALAGLANDNHPQYLLDNGARSGALTQAQLFASGIEAQATMPYPASAVRGLATQTAESTTAASIAQRSDYVLSNTTSDATATELFTDGSGARHAIQTDSTNFFEVRIAARRQDAADESAAYLITGCIDNYAGITALVGTPSVTVVAEDSVSWTVTVAADDTNDVLGIMVTGEVGKTIYWVAHVALIECIVRTADAGGVLNFVNADYSAYIAAML